MQCPTPSLSQSHILMAHGGGGKLTQELIEEVFLPAFNYSEKPILHDGVTVTTEKNQVVITTDAFVVKPIFFPGGDIGKLSVIGTCNDLAMCGAKPQSLTASFILEEGFPVETLVKVVNSMARACDEVGVRIIAGDTKVVGRGSGDGIFISMTGLGAPVFKNFSGPSHIQVGDKIIISGDIGRHGVAILSARNELGLATNLQSDCMHLWPIVNLLHETNIEPSCMRDLTRGGLASALVELAQASHHHFNIEDVNIPIGVDVRGATELLGLDPIHIANEGRMILFVKEDQAPRSLEIIQNFPGGESAKVIGNVLEAKENGLVTRKNSFGISRRVEMFNGEHLPRIC